MTLRRSPISAFFFFNDTATTEIYTLSLHDALPISSRARVHGDAQFASAACNSARTSTRSPDLSRSEEHTSELQSRLHLVCRLLLEKKKKTSNATIDAHYGQELGTQPHDAGDD